MSDAPVTFGLLISLALVLVAILGIVARGLSMHAALRERVAKLETQVDRLVKHHNGAEHGAG